MVLGIRTPVPDRLIKLHQRLRPNLTLRELQGVAGKINALLAGHDGPGKSADHRAGSIHSLTSLVKRFARSSEREPVRSLSSRSATARSSSSPSCFARIVH